VTIGSTPPVTEVAQVMRFGVAVVLVGATLGNDAGVVECFTGAGMGMCEDGGVMMRTPEQ
jgi:hypothetical protein